MSDTAEIPHIRRGARGFLVSDAAVMIYLYIGALTLHILMTLCTTIFNLTPDEYSVTAVAAYFNGYDWKPTVSMGGYYGYVQSLFYIPVFRMTDDPYLRYRIMLIINGVIMSFVPVIVYHLSRRTFNIKKAASVLFSLICGLYPSYMLLTKYTWNETMCSILPWIFVLLMYKAGGAENSAKKQVLSVLGGLTLAAAYGSHGRMLALVAAGLVLQLLVFLTMKKKRVFCFAGFYGGAAAGLVADKFIKNFIQNALWNMGGEKAPTNTLEEMLSRLITVQRSSGDITGVSISENVSFEKFFDSLIGHLFYFISSTWGFGAICIVAVIAGLVFYYKRRSSKIVMTKDGEVDPKTGPYTDDVHAVLLWFTLLVMGAAFVISIAFKSTSPLYYERADSVIYGRYTEYLYPIAILATMVPLYRGKLGIGQCFAALCLGAVVDLLTMLRVVPVFLSGERFVSAMILGIAPMRYGERVLSLLTQDSFIKMMITTISMLFVWVLVRMIRNRDTRAYCYIAIPQALLLLYSNIYCYTQYTIPQGKNSLYGAEYVSEAIDLLDGEFDGVTCFGLPRDRYVKAQFLYDDLDVEVVTSLSKLADMGEDGELPDIVLAGREANLDLWLDGAHRIGSADRNVQIFACTEKAVEWAEDKGLRVSGGNGRTRFSAAELPATTHAVRVGKITDPDYDGDDVTLSLPNGAAVYTNYFTLYKAGRYYFTVRGEDISGAKISVTSDKGDTTLNYSIAEQRGDAVVIKVIVGAKTENVRFKLTNSGAEPMTVSSLEISTSGAAE